MSSYLVLVADQARARLFKTQNRTGALTEIQGLTNPQARLREQDLITDGSGGNPHDLGNHGEVHAHLADNFAKDVSAALEKAVSDTKPDRVHVAASPQFLGLLRKHWNPATQAKIAQELAKDLTHMSPEQIRSHLPELL